MKTEQQKYSKETGWKKVKENNIPGDQYDLVLAFGSRMVLGDLSVYDAVRSGYPNAEIVMSSTAGEILDTEVNDDTISLTAVCFEKSRIQAAVTSIANDKDSYDAGIRLANSIGHEGLKSVLVISDGRHVNAHNLITALCEQLPRNVIITGGMAGDGTLFKSTIVGLNEPPVEGKIVMIGFYGNDLFVSYKSSAGGWNPFGVERHITKSDQNVVYELDDKPALDVYRLYLGDYASELPGSAMPLLLSIRLRGADKPEVRTILSVNEDEKSLTFSGNIPRGSYVRLMKASFRQLIDEALFTANNSFANHPGKPDLAILVSYVGRKMVLNQRAEEEVEAVRTALGQETTIAGFYSYAEISATRNAIKNGLNNQTITITTLSER